MSHENLFQLNHTKALLDSVTPLTYFIHDGTCFAFSKIFDQDFNYLPFLYVFRFEEMSSLTRSNGSVFIEALSTVSTDWMAGDEAKTFFLSRNTIDGKIECLLKEKDWCTSITSNNMAHGFIALNAAQALQELEFSFDLNPGDIVEAMIIDLIDPQPIII